VRDFEYVEVVVGCDDKIVNRHCGRVEILNGDSVIQPGDHVVVFCVEKKLVHKVAQLFQVSFGLICWSAGRTAIGCQCSRPSAGAVQPQLPDADLLVAGRA
jgi:hypothetical protein